MTQGTTPPGWYDDGHGAQRWWDGAQWTEHTQPPPAAPAAGPDPESPADTPHDGTPDLTKGTGGTATPPGAPASDVTMVAGSEQPGQSAYGQQAGPGTGGQPPYAAQQLPGQPPYGAQQPPSSGQQPYAGQPAYGPPGAHPASAPRRGGKGKLFAIIGGVLALLLVGLILLAVLLAGSDDDGPGSTVEAFFDDAVSDNCDVVEYFSNGTLQTDDAGRDAALDTARQECEDSGQSIGAGSEGCDIEVTDESVDGESATVDYDISGCDDESSNETGSFDLVREDGDWRIDGGF